MTDKSILVHIAITSIANINISANDFYVSVGLQTENELMQYNFASSLIKTKKMKTKLLVIALSILTLASCKKDDEVKPSGSGNPPSGNVNQPPQGNVPSKVVGKWLHGTFAMANYWATDGSWAGNPFTQSVAFDFNSNGGYEMFYAGQTNNWGCTTNAYSYYKGTVNFVDSTFTVTPTQGNFRGYYNCTPQYNFNRPATASELKVQTFYYHFETDAAGKEWLVVGFEANDPYPSYFAATTW